MPDTSVYSKFDTNSYLRQYAVIGEHPTLGEGWEYIRLRLNKLMVTTEKSILKAEYYTHNLYTPNSSTTLELSTVDQDWSSTQMIWSNKVIPIKMMKFLQTQNVFEITDFVKRCINDQLKATEANGLILQTSKDYTVVATSDNSSYTPYIKIELQKKPLAFTALDNINQ